MSEIKVELTDSEWMDLIDGERPNGLSKCCPNVSNLRDQIIALVRDGGVFNIFTIEEFRRALAELTGADDDPTDYIHAEYVRQIVDTFPPLGPGQRDKLAGLFRGAARSRSDPGNTAVRAQCEGD